MSLTRSCVIAGGRPSPRADVRRQRAAQLRDARCFLGEGPLFWDGEHRFPNNVGPEGLRPTKAWEIHPIKLLAER